MKIAVVHNDFSLYWRPRLHALGEIARQHGGELHAIEVSAKGSPYDFASGDSDLSPTEFPVTTLFPDQDVRTISPARVCRVVSETLDRLNPDIVVSCPFAFSPGAAAIRWCRDNRRGVVMMDNVRRPDVLRSRIVNAVKQRFYANVDAMLIPAASHTATYEAFGIPRERLFFGLNVTDNEWFAARAEAAKKSGFREALGRPLPTRFFLVVGRQVPKKNLHGVLNGYARYLREAKQSAVDLLLVGEGVEHDALQQRVRQEGISGVHFLPFLKPSDLAVVYAAAQALILGSFHGETWGIVANEAMACGLPVLVSNECGCSETLVDPGKNGWTFDPHNANDIEKALSRLALCTAEQWADMSRHSREIVSHWGLRRFAEGAWAAIEASQSAKRGYATLLDRALLNVWKGRYRPT